MAEPIGIIYHPGMSTKEIIIQLAWLDPISMYRERATHPEIRRMIDDDKSGFISHWLSHFTRPLNPEQQNEWRTFVERMPWRNVWQNFVGFVLGYYTRVEFSEDQFESASKMQVFVFKNWHFQYAIKKGYTEIVRKLLKSPNIDPFADNNRAIHYAAERGYTYIFRLLIDHGIDPDWWAFVIAVENGNVDILRIMIKLPNFDPASENSFTFVFACRNNRLEVVKFLLSIPSIDPANRDNLPIQEASMEGHVEIVRLLLETPNRGIEPTQRAVDWAAMRGHTEVLRLLFARNQNLNFRRALYLASLDGRIDSVRFLLTIPHIEPLPQEVLSVIDSYMNKLSKEYQEILRLFLSYENVRTPEIMKKLLDSKDEDILRIVQSLSPQDGEDRKRSKFVNCQVCQKVPAILKEDCPNGRLLCSKGCQIWKP